MQENPTENHVLRTDMADVVNLEPNYVDGTKPKRPFGHKPRDRYIWYDGSNYPDNDKVTPIFRECPKLGGKVDSQNFGIKPLAGLHTERLSSPSCSFPPQLTGKRSLDHRPHKKDWIDVYFSPVLSAPPSSETRRKDPTHAGAKTSKEIPLQGTMKHTNVNAQFKDVVCDMPGDDVIDMSPKAAQGYSMAVCMMHEDCTKVELPLHRRRSDAQVTPNCVLGFTTSPYEADIGIDTLSLQPQRSSSSQRKETSLPSALYLHQDGPPIENVVSVRLPAAYKPAPKWSTPSGRSNEVVPYSGSAQSCSSEVVPYKSSFKGCELMDSFSGQKKKIISSSYTRVSLAATTRSLPMTHAHDEQQKVGRPSLVPPFSKVRVHDDASKSKVSSHVSYGDIKYMEKADAFVPHSPLLLKEVSAVERQGGGPMVVPFAPLPSKVPWDRRSKSMGVRASLKSAVRSLEVTFSGSRSVSLPKARFPAQKPKPETASLLDRVFVSPMRARRKLVSTLQPIERPPQLHTQSNERKESRALPRGERQLSALSSHVCPTLVRPILSLGLGDVDVTCKPLLQAPKSLRSLPGPRGVESSSRKLNWVPPSAVGCMQNAQLHCTVKDGLPCYTMTMEGFEEMMLARPDVQESHLSKEGRTWQYLFHSGQSKAKGTQGASGWRSWGRKESKAASDLSGIMHVSSAVQLGGAMASSRGFIVSEFVLYDGTGARVAQSRSLRLCSGDTKPSMLGSSRENPCSLTPSSSSAYPLSVSPAYSSMASEQNTSYLPATSESVMGLRKGHRSSLSLDVWSVDLDPPGSPRLPSPCSASQVGKSQVELAAMVIQVSAESHTRGSNGTDGDCNEGLRSKEWGLKLLDGFSSLSCDVTVQEGLMPFYASNSSDIPSSRKSNHNGVQEGSTQNLNIPSLGAHAGLLGSLGTVTLLLPVSDHGLPNGGMRRPSSLIERWRSGGSCECGGWDLGCGMRVMSSNNRSENTNATTLPHNQSVGLFSQGSKDELVLALIFIKGGEFKVSFKVQLSPLKAFATAVAILHSHLSPLLLSSSRSSSLVSM